MTASFYIFTAHFDRFMVASLLFEHHSVDSHLANNLLYERQLTDRHLANRHLSNRHLAKRHFANRHLTNRHLANRHLANRHLADTASYQLWLVNNQSVYCRFTDTSDSKPCRPNVFRAIDFRPNDLKSLLYLT